MKLLMLKNKHNGFTLFELILTITLIGILTALSITGLNKFKYSQIHKTDVENLLTLVHAGRIKASTGENGRDYAIEMNTANRTFTLKLIQSDVNDPTYNETITLDPKTSYTETVQGSEIIFQRFTGTTTQIGTITLTTTAPGFTKTSIITIYPTGLAALD